MDVESLDILTDVKQCNDDYRSTDRFAMLRPDPQYEAALLYLAKGALPAGNDYDVFSYVSAALIERSASEAIRMPIKQADDRPNDAQRPKAKRKTGEDRETYEEGYKYCVMRRDGQEISVLLIEGATHPDWRGAFFSLRNMLVKLLAVTNPGMHSEFQQARYEKKQRAAREKEASLALSRASSDGHHLTYFPTAGSQNAWGMDLRSPFDTNRQALFPMHPLNHAQQALPPPLFNNADFGQSASSTQALRPRINAGYDSPSQSVSRSSAWSWLNEQLQGDGMGSQWHAQRGGGGPSFG